MTGGRINRLGVVVLVQSKTVIVQTTLMVAVVEASVDRNEEEEEEEADGWKVRADRAFMQHELLLLLLLSVMEPMATKRPRDGVGRRNCCWCGSTSVPNAGAPALSPEKLRKPSLSRYCAERSTGPHLHGKKRTNLGSIQSRRRLGLESGEHSKERIPCYGSVH